MSLRLDGQLGPPDTTRLEEHLRSCTNCAAQWAALREADTLIRVSARRPVPPPADFTARVMLRVAVTPVARPGLWERERLQVQGGRPTIKLGNTGPISGHPIPAPLGYNAMPPPRTGVAGFLEHFLPLRDARMGVYLGGISVAGTLSLLVLLLVSVFWMGGGVLPVPGLDLLTGTVDAAAVATWGTTLWTLANDLLAQIDPLLAVLATLVVVGLGVLWWRIVLAFARRTGDREAAL